MKKIGIIIKYDGYNGKIIDEEKNIYELYNKNLLEKVNEKDIIEFEVQEYNGIEIKKKIAMFIKKYNRTK